LLNVLVTQYYSKALRALRLAVVLAHRFDGARLGTLLPFFFSKMHFSPNFHMIEVPVQHTVPMEIELSPVIGFEEAVALLAKDLADPSHGDSFMSFYLATLASRIILQLATSSLKGFLNGDINIFMGAMLGGFSIDHYLPPGHLDIHAYVIGYALVVVPVGNLHNYPAARNPVIEVI
jgi:hypothetical protein